MLTWVADKWKNVSSLVAVGVENEFISVRLAAGRTPVTIMNLYGSVEKGTNAETDKRWGEIQGEIQKYIEEGEVIVAGDMNTFLGKLGPDNMFGIDGNPNEKVSHGGRNLQYLLEQGDIQLLNNTTLRV